MATSKRATKAQQEVDAFRTLFQTKRYLGSRILPLAPPAPDPTPTPPAALRQGLAALVAAQHELLQQQAAFYAAVTTTLARIETLLTQMCPPDDAGHNT